MNSPNKMETDFNSQTLDLNKELERIKILARIDPDQVEAQKKVPARKSEEAQASGNKDKATRLKGEIVDLQRAVEKQTADLQEIECKKETVQARYRPIARAIYETYHAKVAAEVRDLLTRTCDQIKTARDSLTAFNNDHDLNQTFFKLFQTLKIQVCL